MLTPRQAEILALVGEGLTYRQIAEELGISHRTVDAHIQLALRDLGVPNRAAAAVEYARRCWAAGKPLRPGKRAAT